MLPDKNFHLEIDSDPNNLITVEEFINYFSKELKINNEKISALLLAITEATTNAIIHGNKCDLNKKVNINVTVEGDELIVKIRDEGKGFDPHRIPDPTKPENLLKDSGRGVYLMRVYMKDLKYKITAEGTETILTLAI